MKCAGLTRLMFVQYSVAEYERVNSSVFNFHLNTGSNENYETKGGKLLQTHAAAAEKKTITNRRVL